jgi:PKHD-type hydroxylase
MTKESDDWYIGRFCESKIFNKKELKDIRSWIKNQKWECGLNSLRVGESVDSNFKPIELKNNEQTCEGIPEKLVWPAIDRNIKFNKFTQAKSSRPPMCTRTLSGGYYNPHFDDVNLGHFSTTIFLSDPDEYDGGELVLYLDGKEVFFKPKAGRSVTYLTGIGHRVNKVTRGTRLACIFWTKSKWDNLNEFFNWRYYDYMVAKLNENKPETVTNDLYEFLNDPSVVLRNKMYNCARRAGVI